MKELIPMNEYGIFAGKDRIVRVDSQFVAEMFGKRHDNVLRDIEQLDCSKSFKLKHFTKATYINQQEKKMPCYHMSFIGFLLLVLGYTGTEAARIKETLITNPWTLLDLMDEYEKKYGPMAVDEADAMTNPTHYKYVMVDGKQIPEHRVIWESVHGPIPEGAVIHHKDGNKENNAIENLELFPSNAAHVKYHAGHGKYYFNQRKKLRGEPTGDMRLNDDLEYQPLKRCFTLLYSDAGSQMYCVEKDMIISVALGMSEEQFRKANNIPEGVSIRLYLTDKQISDIVELQRADVALLSPGA